ncbi:MAG: cobalamin-binding protein [Sulfurimicrobium sp.]|nr:cobalamin-binding protein [Sulfurimicrobium sp.]MDP1705466.1 cobalamin-binding protein [Sulfurimicrobium sp.]MDP2199512.1 cobalamin-binding protein [Sulfurimicrobium sp.]MDP2961696.1 cobalamin-binding protein [Sulfurimicrobium sp.]MDP3687888.1 cobalamin-binding protein [Sulfurimicrobium sp.]
MTVSLSQPARRIVSLAPHVTELVFAAGAGDHLVGVTAFSDYPPAAQRIPSLGDSGKVDVERILALKPDLLIAWQSGNHSGDLVQLERLGVKLFVTEPRHLQDIPRLLRAIGILAGTGADADLAATRFERRMAELKKQFGARGPVSVFYQIWDAPLMTVNREHMINDVIELCGGRNIFASLSSLTPAVSKESVVALNPEVIIASGGLYQNKQVWNHWRQFASMRAVREERLYFIHPDLIQRQTTRILEGAQRLCEQLDRAR